MKPRLDIVNELCAAIEQDGRSPTAIAHLAGVTPSTVSNWLSGQVIDPRVQTLDKVARVLGRRFAWADGYWTLGTVIRSAQPFASDARETRHRHRMLQWR